MNRFFLTAGILMALVFHAAAQKDESRLMRFPSTNGEVICFSYAGDLYTVPMQGGVARKLTSDVGYEMFSHFSPDGTQIAFTGQYDGNTEVFVMPAEGGEPKRLTVTATLGRDMVSDRMGPNNIVMTWTPDGKSILYRSRKQSFNSFKGQLFEVSVEGGLSKEVPLSDAGFCSFSPDGQQLAFNRVFREFRTWKYYQGGMADDIHILDRNTKSVKTITDTDAQDIFPMWAGDDIYFLSDRERTMNLFVYHQASGTTEKVTDFTEYDIKFPTMGKGYIVFENGGYLYKFSLQDKKAVKVPVVIENDFVYARKAWYDAADEINGASLSPNGERVAFTARGELFNVPATEGLSYNLTQTSGVHERDAVWSPDGKYIAYLSDESGEFEIYMRETRVGSTAIQLTSGADTYKYSLEWSPDSKKILWTDRKLRLQYVDVQSKAVTLVKQSEWGMFYSYNWSPDSKWIVFDENTDNDFSVVCLYRLSDKSITQVTDNWYESGSASFSDDGKYLVFVSDRDFNPLYSQTEWNHAYDKMGKVYLAILSKDTPSPFAPENATVAVEERSSADKKGKDKKGKKKEAEPEAEEQVPDVKIDLDGISDRLVALPIDASNYYHPVCYGDKVYYQSWGDGRGTWLYNLKDKKETKLGTFQFTVSSKGNKMLVIERKKMQVMDLPQGEVKLDETIDLSHMQVYVDKQQEWKQIYDEAWRQMRDFFYVENMHGVDWKAMHDKYAVLLPYVKHRDDLTYLIGELIGELSIGHAYVNSSGQPKPERIKTGLLGAQISADASGYFRIDELLKGQNWDESLRSPLTEIGVNAKVGDYIVAVNGVPTNTVKDLYSLLIGKANQTVELSLNSSPSESGARSVLVKPIADEASLYYYNWVQTNIDKVTEATKGEVGYIHIPDMGPEGLVMFTKLFYPQLNKKALIIDDRGNGGGNVSPMILERLRREVQRSTMRRNFPHPSSVPGEMVLGPKVLLIDRYSASDGDLFPYGFKHYGLGTVIGVRSWGGVVGITGSLPFIDGSDLRKPEFASYSSEESEWIIEGHGVEPDIVLDNDPYQEYMGNDEQLNKAIEVVLEQLKTGYKALPAIPVAPDKSK